MNQPRIMEILCDTKKLAQEYRTLTGKPLLEAVKEYKERVEAAVAAQNRWK